MTSTEKYHKNYTEFCDTYQLVLPLNLEGLIPTDESVRLLSHMLEELDYHSLYQAYSHEGRNPAVEPSLMFKILVYAYSRGIYSNRKIEQACCRKNMTYIEEADCYVCTFGRILWNVGLKKKTSVTGYVSYQDNYRCEDCTGCPYFGGKCTRSSKPKQLQVSKLLIEKRAVSLKNITSKTGISYRMNRSIQVEGAFGVLKHDYGFNRFLTCGKINVKIEFLLLCMGYNINKLHAKIQGDRLKSHLHKAKTA